MRHIAAALAVVLVIVVVHPSIAAAPSAAVEPSLGVFQGSGDVGPVKTPGTTSYAADAQTYTLTGSGTNMWAEKDEFQFAWRRMSGDFLLTARVRLGAASAGANPHRKLGLIARASLEPDAPYADAALHGDGLASLQFRRAKAAATEEQKSDVGGADILQLERHGDVMTMSVAKFGETFKEVSQTGIAPAGEVYVGLFVCAHDPDRVESATFENVRLVVPAGPDLVPYRDYLGSHVELLDVDSGARRIVTSASDSLQAPNWTPDGKSLIYNHNGRLVRFDLASGTGAEIDTGTATNNNNDHVLSFDGKWLGISNHVKEDSNNSNVFVVPVGGGVPRRVTERGPSYLHGWSPDGKRLIYTAERNGDFDIYAIPSKGGPEVQLTKSKGLDDGSEYAPDGKHIYFNSARTGTMQLWRMRPDGSGEEQLTNDAFNNWFPHVSPNGKRIVFLSFGKDVRADDHPFYKHVYLREMPIAGGAPRVIGYLYGGQGTINVPSWSPDSRRVAFVSNTGAY